MEHTLTDKGLEPDTSNVSAITKMPRPEDKAGVKRFLGMCQYLSKFCPNLSTSVLPLRELTKQDAEFIWSNTHESAFHAAKELISKATALRYYDLSLTVTLQVDASENSVGGVLLQQEQPVCFTSHTLRNTETVRVDRKGMSRNLHMYEQMAPISVRQAAHYSTYRSSATRANL